MQGLSVGEKAGTFRRAFWKFLRPHTIRGSILGASSVTARALLENQHVRAPPQPPPLLRGGGGGLGIMRVALGRSAYVMKSAVVPHSKFAMH